MCLWCLCWMGKKYSRIELSSMSAEPLLYDEHCTPVSCAVLRSAAHHGARQLPVWAYIASPTHTETVKRITSGRDWRQTDMVVKLQQPN